MIQRISYPFLLLSLTYSLTHAHQLQQQAQQVQEQSIEDKILKKGKDITLWKELRKQIILCDAFQEACQTEPPQSVQQWEKFFDDVPVFDEPTKLYTLQVIKNNSELITLEDVLDNKVTNPFALQELLNTLVGGEIVEKENGEIEISVTEKLEEVLTKKAIRHVKSMEEIKENLQEVQGLIKKRDELIAQQQVQINTIEENVVDAKEQVQEAEQNIEKAEKYQRNARHIYYMLIALALLLLLLVIAFFRRRKKR